MRVWVKICGITCVEDALFAVDAGADAIGVNFVARSKRRVDVKAARELFEAVGARVEVVGVVADLSVSEAAELRERTGIAMLQLHGSEPAGLLQALLPNAYKAVGVAGSKDVDAARAFLGERLLADAKVSGELGGTGQTFDWGLVEGLSRERALIVAGGLDAGNVAAAIERTRPFGVDVASGVESADPRRKDADRVARFVRAARMAAAELSD